MFNFISVFFFIFFRALFDLRVLFLFLQALATYTLSLLLLLYPLRCVVQAPNGLYTVYNGVCILLGAYGVMSVIVYLCLILWDAAAIAWEDTHSK